MTKTMSSAARAAEALIAFDRWRANTPGLGIDSAWRLDRMVPQIATQLLIKARAETHFVVDVGFNRSEEGMDPATLQVAQAACFNEGRIFTPERFRKALNTCQDRETAYALQAFFTAVNSLRDRLLRREAKHFKLRALDGDMTKLQARANRTRRLREDLSKALRDEQSFSSGIRSSYEGATHPPLIEGPSKRHRSPPNWIGREEHR